MAQPPGDDWNRRALLAWALVLAATWIVLVALDYSTRDADSRLYSEIAARMSETPVSDWIAPEFPPGWFMSGPFREHPAGLFAPPAFLARLGYPAKQSAYAVGALYVVVMLLLLQRLAHTLVPSADARVLGWALQLLPVAFTYRIRANHEQVVLLCLVLALLGLELSRRHLAFASLTATAFVALLLVKGVFALFGPVLCVVWLFCPHLNAPRQALRAWRPWLGLALAILAMTAAALLYELLYRTATGQPFWSFYVSRQFGVAASSGSGSSSVAANAVWYLGRVLWFPFPWSVVLALLGARGLRAHFRDRTSPGAPRDPAARAGVAFAVATTILYVGLFSLSTRKADRYIFPVYYALASIGAIGAVRTWPPLRRLADRLDRPWVAPAVFAVTSAAHILAGRLGVPTVKIWTASP